jgi:exopolyphosphatase/pppGpp-phosphohydrolase
LQNAGLSQKRIQIIATEAIRDAKNQNEFLESYQKLNFTYRIRVLPHLEEATLEALGAVKVHSEIEQTLIVGLGGQSMQISDVANRSQFLKYKKLTKPYQFQD